MPFTVKSKLPRLAREFYQGRNAILWTHTMEHRATGWLSESFHQKFREVLLHACGRYAVSCPCYVLMPDHWYMLWLGLNTESDQQLATAFLRKHLSPELNSVKLQDRAHDHLLREDERLSEAFQSACSYVFNNAQRANLCPDWREWPFLGAMIMGYPTLDPRKEEFWSDFWKIHNRLIEREPDPCAPAQGYKALSSITPTEVHSGRSGTRSRAHSMIPLPPNSRDLSVWLHVGTLLDGTSQAPAHDAHVVYRGDTILFVGTGGRTPPRELLRLGQEIPDVVAPNATLLPGLIDAHAHLFLEGGELALEKRAATLKQSSAELLTQARERLEKLLRLGIAGVRDAGDKDGVGLALSKLYASEARPLMPYLESPGAAIYHQGRYGSFMGDPLENHASPDACVAARIAAGADRIKLIPTGIINFKQAQVTSEPQMNTEEIALLVAAAKARNRQTFAHASGDRGIDHVIAGGVDSVEHGFFIRDDQLARLRDLRTAWVPTFSPVQKQVDHAALMGWDEQITSNLRGILERHAASLVRAHELGVLIVAGSDAGSVGVAHGYGMLEELELMERAGLPPLAVINAATGVSAERFAYKEKLGKIAPGYRSRFILTEHSPLQKIANLRQPRLVIFDGAVFETGLSTSDHGM